MASRLKRLLVGTPIASSEELHHRLPKVVALAVFASDAISSTAYATQEVEIVLIPGVGADALEYLIPIAVAVCVLLAIVITSYRQTIKAISRGIHQVATDQKNTVKPLRNGRNSVSTIQASVR